MSSGDQDLTSCQQQHVVAGAFWNAIASTHAACSPQTESGTAPLQLPTHTDNKLARTFKSSCPLCMDSNANQQHLANEHASAQRSGSSSSRASGLCSYHTLQMAACQHEHIQDVIALDGAFAVAQTPTNTAAHKRKTRQPAHYDIPIHIILTDSILRHRAGSNLHLFSPVINLGRLLVSSTSTSVLHGKARAIHTSAVTVASGAGVGAAFVKPSLLPSLSTASKLPSLPPAKSRTLPVPAAAGDVTTAAARAGAMAATVSMARSFMRGEDTAEAASKAAEASAVSSAATVSSAALSTLVAARAIESGMSAGAAQALGSFVGAGVGAMLSTMYQAAGECLLSDRAPGEKGKCVTSYVAQGASSAAAGWGACAAAAAVSGPAATVTCPVAAFIASWGAKTLAKKAIPDR